MIQNPSFKKFLSALGLSAVLLSCTIEKTSLEGGKIKSISHEEKQRGTHVFGRLDSTNFQFLINDNIQWITLVPWGFQEDIDSPEVFHHRGDSSRIKRRNMYWLRQIQRAREVGLKVFVKPHVWMHRPSSGKWRSDIFPVNEENWVLWQNSYREFIMRYAQLAEQAGAEMFCLGTEFTRLAIEKPEYWKALIEEVRSVYSGKLTYAANWYNEYEEITFWGDLDYVGIQAYFPLVDHENPELADISGGWDPHLRAMEKVHRRFGRNILFTELGYKSTPNSAMKPWEWMDHANTDQMEVSFKTQSNCYEAFFERVWIQPWFAGVHLWQYRSDFKTLTKDLEYDFTPQGKPAKGVIARGFQK